MSVRKIIKIDEEKCDGCGQCVVDCAEGALEIVDGKARVVRESFCDGLGACIGACPTGALTIEEREAELFDEQAAAANVAASKGRGAGLTVVPSGCPGAAARPLEPRAEAGSPPGAASQLGHWPVQLKLVAPNAPFLREADLLLVADCVPLAMADFHHRLLRGRAVVVGCPKLDDRAFYIDKLAEVVRLSSISSLTVARMEVPCCGGLCWIAEEALKACRQKVPIREVVVGTSGQIVSERDLA